MTAPSRPTREQALAFIQEKYTHPDMQIGDWAHRRHVAFLLAEVHRLNRENEHLMVRFGVRRVETTAPL